MTLITRVHRWVRDSFALRATDPIDVIDVLSTSLEGPRPRLPRIEVASLITVREGASIYRMRLCDISQGGMKVACEAALAEGSDVVVTLPGIAPQPGVIRWAAPGAVGITFNRALALATLVDWLKEQRQSDRATS